MMNDPMGNLARFVQPSIGDMQPLPPINNSGFVQSADAGSDYYRDSQYGGAGGGSASDGAGGGSTLNGGVSVNSQGQLYLTGTGFGDLGGHAPPAGSQGQAASNAAGWANLLASYGFTGVKSWTSANSDGSSFVWNPVDKSGNAIVINGTSGGQVLPEVVINGNAKQGSEADETVEAISNILENIDRVKSAAETTSLFTKNDVILSTSEFLEETIGASGGKYIPLISAGINQYKYSTKQISTGQYYVNQTGILGGIIVEGQVGGEFGGPWGAAAGLGFGITYQTFFEAAQQQATQMIKDSSMFQPNFSAPPF